ncbi:PEGA domain-containing protein [Candidatus Gottesmanbacteria bacterium]|nr:PEGA domain-containing protein [Candidatus Gottesmanbacteria bacterium]
MKRNLVFLVVLVALLGLVIGFVKIWNRRSAKFGELRVESVPPASVFLDNKHMGRTPFRDKVQAGQYTIKVVPEASSMQAASWQAPLSIGESLLTYVSADLSESELSSAADILWLEKISGKNGELSVTTNPDGATVLVDDQVKGVTPLSTTDMSSGDHMLTVTSPGFLSRTQKIKSIAGYRVIASIKLALSAGGAVVASASPTPVTQSVTRITPTGLPLSSDPAKPFVIIKDTPTGYLRVRLEPTTTASEAARVKPGEKYHLEEIKTSWYKIKYDGSNTGWISGQYAEKVE